VSVAIEAFECTSTELLYLASLRGGRSIIGINDPLRGLSEAEVETELLRARDALAARRFLVVGNDGRITLDYDVARLVDAVARPRRTFFAFEVTASAADAVTSGQRRVFHIRGSVAVEIVAELGREPVEVVPVAGRAGVCDAVLAFFSVGDQPAAAGGVRTTVTQRAMHAAASLAAHRGAEACASVLRDAGAPEPSARALAVTLSQPLRNAALLALDASAPAGQTLALGLLAGANGLWRLRPFVDDEVPMIEVEPSSGPALAAAIREFVTGPA